MKTARVAAQAKVNLLLHVLAREASGYHAIETVFLRLDLADDVRVKAGGSARTIDCAGVAMPATGLGPPTRNLAYRAAEAYAAATGWPSGFSIEIDKRIPVGAGLGGGSADAGAVLRALDSMAPRPLGVRLLELAAALGSDVPFMTLDRPMALGWGRGERLLPLAALPRKTIALLIPDFAISTADAYGWLAAARGEYRPAARAIPPKALATWRGISGIASNDFDDVVRRRFPIIGELAAHLTTHRADIAMLSGSGSTVFGVFSRDQDARKITRVGGAAVLFTRTSGRVVRVVPNA